MKPTTNYDDIQAYKKQERLPAGGYAIKILNAEEENTQYGRKLRLDFDIAEGDFRGFFQQNYSDQVEPKKWKGSIRLSCPEDPTDENDRKAAARFKGTMTDIEEANPGFHWDWDETKLKGKVIGAMFRNKEYDFDGRHGFFTECCWLTRLDIIRDGKYTVPDDKLLSGNAGGFSGGLLDDDGDLPWKN